jgi:hypothetical protein
MVPNGCHQLDGKSGHHCAECSNLNCAWRLDSLSLPGR